MPVVMTESPGNLRPKVHRDSEKVLCTKEFVRRTESGLPVYTPCVHWMETEVPGQGKPNTFCTMHPSRSVEAFALRAPQRPHFLWESLGKGVPGPSHTNLEQDLSGVCFLLMARSPSSGPPMSPTGCDSPCLHCPGSTHRSEWLPTAV
jgi:hypothetical protein